MGFARRIVPCSRGIRLPPVWQQMQENQQCLWRYASKQTHKPKETN